MRMNDMQYLAAFGEFDKSVLVSAGAGSGKTQVLTTRVKNIIERGTSPLNILVLTFTNAAAAEMKGRVRDMLIGTPELAEYVGQLEQAYITTFDSFNLSICKKYYYALNIGPNISICDSQTMYVKKKEFINEILNELYEAHDALLFEYLDKFTTKKDDSLVKSILDMISVLDKRTDAKSYLLSYEDNHYSDDFLTKINSLYAKTIKNQFDGLIRLLDDLLEVGVNDDVPAFVTTMKELIEEGSLEKYNEALKLGCPRKKKVDPAEYSEISKKITDLRKRIGKSIYQNRKELDDEYMLSRSSARLFVRILISYYEKMDSFRKEYNVHEFNDIQKMAIELVRDNEDIRKELKNRFKEILIDEYQDTSDLQEEFISYFENNNLFMVGDIKQSIYRFRNANPNIFKKKYESYARINKDNYPSNKEQFSSYDGYLIDMNQNFRSRKEVLSDINSIFSQLMTSEVGDASYKESHLMQYGLTLYEDGACTEESGFSSDLITYDYDENVKIDPAYYEAYIIAKDISDKVGKYNVYSKTSGFHKATYDDFCIIFDRGTHMDTTKEVLEYFHIPTVINADKSINDSYISLIIINMMRLVGLASISCYDEVYFHALASVLRSCIYEYTDEQVFDIVSYRNLDNDASLKAAKIAKILDSLSNQEVYEAILQEFGFYESFIKMKDINESLHVTEFLYNKVGDLSKLGYSFNEIIEYMSNLFDEGVEIKYSLDVSKNSGVRMMNIHKSKGLEFPICYFLDFSHDYNSDEMKKRVLMDNELGLCLPVYNNGIKDTAVKTIIKERFEAETRSERLRLFYVALTRAREKMIFIKNEVKAKEAKATNEHKRFSDYFDYILEHGDMFKNKRHYSPEDLAVLQNIQFGISNVRLALNDNARISYKNILVDAKLQTSKRISKDTLAIIDDDIKKRMGVGTKYHEYLELLDFKNLSQSLDELTLDKNERFILSRFIKNEVFANIKDAKVLKEHEFIFNNGGDEFHGIIDLLAIYPDHIDIIDYKLKNYDDEAYDRQLKIYASYAKEKSNLPINCYLLSIIDNTARKVEL